MAIGWSLAAQRLVTNIAFRLFRLLFVAVQRLYWELNGTAQKLREADDPRYYERSAQVLDILAFHYFCAQPSHKLEYGLCVHNRFENPQYVIDNENVSLYAVTDRNAVFSVADKGVKLWQSEHSSFVRLAQLEKTKQFIVVPLKVFHRMAEKIGDPKGELIFLFNTARCGSTLLTQVMEYTGRCVSVSEPDAPMAIALKYRNEGDSPELRQLARDVIRWECRPYPSMQPPPLAYVLKLISPSALLLPLCRELYPNSRNMFMYRRDIVKASKSLYRMSYPLPSTFLAYKLGRLSGAVLESVVHAIGMNGRDFRIRLTDNLHLGFILTCIVTDTYMSLRRKGSTDIVAVCYEDIVGNPTESFRKILEYCRLPTDLLEAGLRGLEVDSQRNSMISKDAIGSIPEPELTPEAIATANALLKRYKLPLIGEEFTLEGTITSLKK